MVDFTIFAENFQAMPLSKQQKDILKASIPGLIGMLGTPLFTALIGRQSWVDSLWGTLIGIGVWAVLVGLFLLGAKVPKKNDEKSTN